MKVVILAGGLGTRLSEETDVRPKPMVDIGGKPILWHIMKIYGAHGFNEFVILLGYKGYYIKDYFNHYYLHQNDVTFDLANNRATYHSSEAEPWTVSLVDTGVNAMTGSRIRRAKHLLGDEPFLLTYGDGVGDVNINALIDYHHDRGGVVTMTAVQPDGKFGAVDIESDNRVSRFLEKPKGDGSWVNGGFFVCSPAVFEYIPEGDQVPFEGEPLGRLAAEGQLFTYKHDGFWKCMDTLKDKQELHDLWSGGTAPWKLW